VPLGELKRLLAVCLLAFACGGSSTTGASTRAEEPSTSPRLVAWTTSAQNGVPYGLSLVDADGTHPRPLTSRGCETSNTNPTSLAGTASIVYVLCDGTPHLVVVDTNGVSRPFLSAVVANGYPQSYPNASADGKWVVFGVLDLRCGVALCPYRARSDGTGIQALPPELGRDISEPHFAPSPDGSQIAITTGRGVRVIDVSSLTLSAWTVPGEYPEWSPNGAVIAYILDGQIFVMNADGSNSHPLTTAADHRYALAPMSWSPDGKRLLARSFLAWDVIDVASGTVTPLAFSSAVSALAFRY